MTATFTLRRDFDATLAAHGIPFDRPVVETLQINVGKFCNQACLHCHVEAGPLRTEKMTRATADRLIELMASSPALTTVDITGGAPELNENFRPLVVAARRAGLHVIDRCNLTVLELHDQADLASFLAEHRVEVIASLPCYSKENVEKQRGGGVFEPSIAALRRLNALGYGAPDSGLALNLVYNPLGAFLPPAQEGLEAAYRRELRAAFGIEFTRLYTITNMPISRFDDWLIREGKREEYLRLLVESFNPRAAENVMCRSLVSVGWDGRLFDCDFNQMLELPVPGGERTIWEIGSLDDLAGSAIATGEHCFGCAAGCGSSCGGAIA
jgi:radical SAM/Cys-rich protein